MKVLLFSVGIGMLLTSCATRLSPTNKGPLDPSGADTGMRGFVKSEWAPYRAQDKLNITGAHYEGNWATRDRAGEILYDKYTLPKK